MTCAPNSAAEYEQDRKTAQKGFLSIIHTRGRFEPVVSRPLSGGEFLHTPRLNPSREVCKKGVRSEPAVLSSRIAQDRSFRAKPSLTRVLIGNVPTELRTLERKSKSYILICLGRKSQTMTAAP